MLELYHGDMSTCAQKVRAQLAEKQLEWTGHALNLRAGDQHRPDFLKLNPKGVVPVLVHDEVVVSESNIIMEYVEDAFPHAHPLLPIGAADRAEVRKWLQHLDTGLHLHIAVLSIGIAFRDQLLEIYRTPGELEAYFAAVPDPALRGIYREVVPSGVDAKCFQTSLLAWRTALEAMEIALAKGDYLSRGSLSLADFGYLPYVCRLHHLQMEHMWQDMPHVTGWFTRMRDTLGYRVGIEAWFNPKYLALMEQQGLLLREKLLSMIAGPA